LVTRHFGTFATQSPDEADIINQTATSEKCQKPDSYTAASSSFFDYQIAGNPRRSPFHCILRRACTQVPWRPVGRHQPLIRPPVRDLEGADGFRAQLNSSLELAPSQLKRVLQRQGLRDRLLISMSGSLTASIAEDNPASPI